MNNLFQLPERPVPEWQATRSTLTELLLEKGHGEEVIEHVMQRFRPVFMNLLSVRDSSPPISDPNEAVAFVNAFFGRFSAGLLMELANLAIENHTLRARQ
jgi:hypothetical protein